jgi:hypothetical protein
MAENDTISHDFAALNASGGIAYSNSYKTGTTAEIVYTCNGTNAKFGMDLIWTSKIAINLPTSSRYVTTSPAVDNMIGLEVWHYKEAGVVPEVYVSTEADPTWRKATGDTIVQNDAQVIRLTLPQNKYNVKVQNSTSSKKYSILKINYIKQRPCNCLRVTL